MSEPGSTPTPEMRRVTGGRWETSCSRCLRPSVPVPATSAESAWEQLKRIGWTWYVSEFGGRGGPECKSCSEAPHSVDEAVARATKRRKVKRSR